MYKRYWGVFITYICSIFLVFYVVAPILITEFDIPKENAFLYGKLIVSILTAIIILFLLNPDIKKGVSKDALPFKKSIKWIILGFLMIIFTQVIVGLIDIYLLNSDGVSERTKAKTDSLVTLSFIPLLINLVTTIIFAPFFEEIMCRKIIFGTLYTKTNFFIASLVSSIAFAVPHMDFNHLLSYIATGFVLSFIYVKTKRIIVSIITHSFVNAFVFLGALLQ
ncbi:type II CAAX endopeptidase family protein [Bacillus sp. B15-48]|uniref:CPBP family intramembrane glutamic endopeptidase n=1 Tax=Bacillus sp. B15-48 TaxID=1548601 RepID=UPI00193FC27B|nr:type II CAAX endopeptidase family protein [Bacillus sp. B15-48]MBM4760907.1 CPBP family intramembrane metalloprotease [Bacillus sp. B15-48]